MRIKNSRTIKFNRLIRVLLNLSLVLLAVVSLAFSQTKNETLYNMQDSSQWITFSPPSKSFTVELPESPKQKTSTPIPPQDDFDLGYLFKCSESVNRYVLPSISNPKYSRFEIWEIDVSRCERKKGDFKNVTDIFALFIGGDAPDFIGERDFNLNGFGAQDFILNKYSINKKIVFSSKIRAVDTGNRILILVYDRLKGNLKEEERIFSTFKPKATKPGKK